MEISSDQVRGDLAFLYMNLRASLPLAESNDQASNIRSLMEEIEALEFSVRLLGKWGDSGDLYNILAYITASCQATKVDYTILESRLRRPRSTICLKFLEPIMYVYV